MTSAPAQNSPTARHAVVSVACAIAVATVASPAFAQAEADAEIDDGRRLSGSLRAGAEYDDNVFRLEGDGQTGGFLSRYFATLDIATRALPRSVAAFSITHGGKFFFENEQGAADTLLTQVSLSYHQQLADPFAVWAQADLKDRTEREPKRDYMTGGASAGVEGTLEPVSLRLGGGARFFAFKPNSEASSSNLQAVSRLSFELPAGFGVFVGYTLAERSFDIDRFELEDDDVVAVEGELREDSFHVAQVGAIYRGALVAELNYSYSTNVSNSFGQGLRRHTVNTTLTAPLPWRLFASAHLELQRTTYDDPVLIDASFLVDEDNRNAAVLSIARALGDHWEVEARYSLYLQEFGVGSDYRRQTILLALGYVFD